MNLRDERKLAQTSQERLAERIAGIPVKELESVRSIIRKMAAKREKKNGNAK